MKAVILAAGVGSRLGRPLPKCLCALPGGETIIERQIRIYREHGIWDVSVVVGFKCDFVMEHCNSVSFFYNQNYYVTNTSKSLVKALRFADDDIIWSNGDVVFDEGVVAELLNYGGNAICVNTSKCGEEEVKYKVNDRGEIAELSKQVKNGLGESVGVNAIRAADLQAFVTALDQCDDNDYFEAGVEFLIDQGIAFKPLDISNYRCIEVDFDEDWQQARQMFAVT